MSIFTSFHPNTFHAPLDALQMVLVRNAVSVHGQFAVIWPILNASLKIVGMQFFLCVVCLNKTGTKLDCNCFPPGFAGPHTLVNTSIFLKKKTLAVSHRKPFSSISFLPLPQPHLVQNALIPHLPGGIGNVCPDHLTRCVGHNLWYFIQPCRAHPQWTSFLIDVPQINMFRT